MLNEEWEPQGCRIILNIWEDYPPEFTGRRKQTDYDLDLVDKSDIVFGMFKKVCGRYSQEEVTRGHNNNPARLHCYALPTDDDTAVRDFEKTSGIAMQRVADIEDVWSRIQKTTEDYITSHTELMTTAQTPKKEALFATLGEDLRTEEDALGDMIRSVDDLSEKQLGVRCSLLPLECSSMISKSDYYLILLDKVLDEQSRDEFSAAYDGQTRKKSPSFIAVFQKKGGTVTRYDAGNQVSETMYQKDKEFFPITLLTHMLRKRQVLSPGSAFDIGEDGHLYFGSTRIMDTGKVLGLHTEHVSEFKVQIELLELMMPSKPKLGIEARLRNEIRDLLSTENLNADKAKLLVDKCSCLIDFLKKNTYRFYQPDYVLRMMLLRIGCNDRYSELLGITPDEFYKEFVDYADRFSIADVLVEEMRINYANGFARRGQEDEAMRLYGNARRNLSQMASTTRILRPRLFLLYYNALVILATIREESELNQWVDELEMLTEQWTAEDNTMAYYRCYPSAFRIDVLSVYVLADERLLSEAEKLLKEMRAISNCYSEDRVDYLKAVNALTKSLARYYVDRIWVDGLSMDRREAYARQAQQYLDLEEKQYVDLMTYDREGSMKQYAGMLHNRGFLQRKKGEYEKAFASYLQSLEKRKWIFANMPSVEHEDDVAETMVNIGALLLEIPGCFVASHPTVKTDALYYAEAALDIYGRHNDGTLYHATNEYKARLLKGTVLQRKGASEQQQQVGITILRGVKQWDEENPMNYYHATIVDELKRSGV